MSAIETFIQLPSETGNTGKKVAVIQLVQGADTVVKHRTVVDRKEAPLGIYRVASARTALAVAAQNGTSSSIFWLLNPAGSGRVLRIRRMSLQYNFIGVTTLTTLPRLVLQRFTWTGTASGAQLAAVPINPAMPAAVADFRTASTGLSVSLTSNTILAADLAPMAQVAGTAAVFETTPTMRSELFDSDASEDEWVTIPEGTGVVLYQADDGGATTETRSVLVNVNWDEVEA